MPKLKLDSGFKNVEVIRRQGSTAAVFFIHGFTGKAVDTWKEFPELLKGDVNLAGYDFFFWGYYSHKLSLNPLKLVVTSIKQHFWESDPDIPTIAKSLRTLLDNSAGSYKKLVLVAHSMGGLVVQQFILNELHDSRPVHLDRLTEVMLYATPSNGQQLAAIGGHFKDQAADMRRDGPFITILRDSWKQHFEAKSNDGNSLARFRLTLVAGGADEFVPPDSSQAPFPNDEHETVEGNHVEATKPKSREEQSYTVLRTRLLRKTRTRVEQAIIDGESPAVHAFRARVEAAVKLGKTEELKQLAAGLEKSDLGLSLDLKKIIGSALFDEQCYTEAVAAFKGYFAALGTPAADGSTACTLAMAFSYAGQPIEAVALLSQLPQEILEDPETQGILGGCFKREWRKTGKVEIAARAQRFYATGYGRAKQSANIPQIIYNGINAAFMALATEGNGHAEIAAEVLDAVSRTQEPDYWTLATKAEALLLMGQFDEALAAYRFASSNRGNSQNWATTRDQALDIIVRLGDPPSGAGLKSFLSA